MRVVQWSSSSDFEQLKANFALVSLCSERSHQTCLNCNYHHRVKYVIRRLCQWQSLTLINSGASHVKAESTWNFALESVFRQGLLSLHCLLHFWSWKPELFSFVKLSDIRRIILDENDILPALIGNLRLRSPENEGILITLITKCLYRQGKTMIRCSKRFLY